MPPKYTARSARLRFWSHVDLNGPIPPVDLTIGPCWLWTGKPDPEGYGTFHPRTSGQPERVYAHRFAYTLLIGPIPDGETVSHLCATRHCINPAHLTVSNRRDLVLRARFGIIGLTRDYCKNGHWFGPENTYIRPNGSRDCRICRKLSVERSRARFRQEFIGDSPTPEQQGNHHPGDGQPESEPGEADAPSDTHAPIPPG